MNVVTTDMINSETPFVQAGHEVDVGGEHTRQCGHRISSLKCIKVAGAHEYH